MAGDMNSKELLKEISIPLLAILSSFIIGTLIVIASGYDPIATYGALLQGAFGGLNSIADTLLAATPLIFTGLTVAFAYRCGLFNIGGEGQLLVGGLTAAWIGTFKGVPMIIHLPLTLLAAMVAGALWVAIPAILKAKLGVHEVITTIMFNYISYSLVAYFSLKVLAKPGSIQTPDIEPSAYLWRFSNVLDMYSYLNIGFLIGLIVLFVIYYLLWKTTIGYEIRAVGISPDAAEYGGISAARNIILAMLISGALAGLGGAERAMGLFHNYRNGFSAEYGFTGIAVALLGRNHPLGIFLAALLFGALSNGQDYMNMLAGVPVDLVTILQAVIILFVAADLLFRRVLALKPEGRKGE
ncbi:nucleoside ABC transporter membrane protein [Orenia metallireducens]|jgi:simple sugar transport system permease protein|uniref:Nucleoside ABC transporter membrane protein n=1 Tax=Orenia metallireducens TaxID=1413210 RepID=A0A285FLJ8_9FIRM|nr:ABC transporter permease [Orenia metallireducens]PRX33573.1 nucleoside ABC transporter membrane protein [Orenia metallireducens]SNY11121.1 nucleoside ABC transporter membrane protein [Orenia metallireducens]